MLTFKRSTDSNTAPRHASRHTQQRAKSRGQHGRSSSSCALTTAVPPCGSRCQLRASTEMARGSCDTLNQYSCDTAPRGTGPGSNRRHQQNARNTTLPLPREGNTSVQEAHAPWDAETRAIKHKPSHAALGSSTPATERRGAAMYMRQGHQAPTRR
jgi:hypothetical protein